ncbi:fl(2)d-associated complex component isoform X3 [Bradysia coprophila]|uniref:fl(2)d-associated complex component isoform X3 n=1 Tax=Bradysia coprophila TaxID=38358 RepID=UPI00187DA0B3|nr:fl(2)d-associated complex component isoform X3 [Bradysia coprophila]
MSKTVKRKITVELPKPRDLSKNRLSVFQRLGTKKLKSLETAININTKPKETKITSTITTTTNLVQEPKPDNVELEDADPDSLEKKRAELQKELELQLKMESSRKVATKEIIRKRKKVRSSSSSSSSSSDSGSSSDSSSSTSSKESKRKIRKSKLRKRGSSSSSADEPRKKSAKVKRVCHKKVDGTKSHKSSHGKKIEGKLRKRSQSPSLRKRVGSSPPKSIQKVPIKNKISVDPAKHHRMKEAARDRERELRDREREKDRERMRSRERVRSRSPKMRPKSRTPKRLSSRDLKHKTPPRRIGGSSGGSMRRDRSIDRVVKKDFKRHDSRERERERREKERLCREDAREAAREKERQEILARCQERHERERREKLRRERDDDRIKPERLLPRPAERAMAIAAARDRSRDKSIDRDRLRSVSHSRSGRERMEREKEPMPYDRVYERDDPRYETHDRRIEKDDRGSLRDERDYIRRHDDGRAESLNSPYLSREKRIVERDDIEWEAGGHGVVSDQRYDDLRDERRMTHDYGSRAYIDDRHIAERDRDWIRETEMGRTDERGMYDRTMDRHVGREWDRADTSHALPRDNYVDNREWSGGMNERQWDNKGAGIGNMGMNDVQRGGPNRRWNSWRGRRGSQHHSGDFRRQQDGFQHDRSSMVYRRPPDVVPTETISQSNATDPVIIHASTVASTQSSLTPKSDVSMTAVVPRSSVTLVVPAEIKVDEKKDDVIDEASVVPEEQLLEEVIPDDLSEFSDEADEILNRQEEDDLRFFTLSTEKQSPPKQLDQQNFNQFIDDLDGYGSGQYFRPDYEPELLEKQNSQNDFNAPIEPPLESTVGPTAVGDPVKDTEPLLIEKQPTPTDLNEVKELPDEMDLDFEEISDGELEEEARIRGLGDALGVDWASLVEESKAIAREKSISTQTSAKQRWQPHSILLDVGISHKWAGQALACRILNDAQQKLKKERERLQEVVADAKLNDGTFKVKGEKLDPDYGDIPDATVNVTMNLDEIKKEDNIMLSIHQPIACIQVGSRNSADVRRNLVFKATGPFSRALSARSDLQMRRVLCGLPKREIGCFETVQKIDPAYTALAATLFQRAIKEAN